MHFTVKIGYARQAILNIGWINRAIS